MTPPFDTAPTALRSRIVQRTALKIAMLAPPWIPVPPPGYGGIESVVSLLCDELVGRGHDVTLFAAPGSRSRARVVAPLQDEHPRQIGSALFESDYVGSVYDAIGQAAARGRPFDIVHDHSGFTALAMAHTVPAPVVHTLHGPFDEQTRPFYARHGHKASLAAISRFQVEHAPPGVEVMSVVPNPIRAEQWPFREAKDDYLLWIGRMDPAKGAHRAIAAARHAGLPLVIAGPVQPGQEAYFRAEIEPCLDDAQVVFAGEVAGVQRDELFARAKALLMPIRWAEPFGMVMVEALACGTPVLAFPEGAASEIVIDSENGYLVDDELQMAEAAHRLSEIDPVRCRQSVISRYDPATVALRYEAVYEHVTGVTPPSSMHVGRSRQSWGEPAFSRI